MNIKGTETNAELVSMTRHLTEVGVYDNLNTYEWYEKFSRMFAEDSEAKELDKLVELRKFASNIVEQLGYAIVISDSDQDRKPYIIPRQLLIMTVQRDNGGHTDASQHYLHSTNGYDLAFTGRLLVEHKEYSRAFLWFKALSRTVRVYQTSQYGKYIVESIEPRMFNTPYLRVNSFDNENELIAAIGLSEDGKAILNKLGMNYKKVLL